MGVTFNMKYLRYVSRAFALASVLGYYIPLMLEDGKISLDELVQLTEKVCEVGGWKLTLKIPKKFEGLFLDAEVE